MFIRLMRILPTEKIYLAFCNWLIIIQIRACTKMRPNIIVFGTPTCSWCKKVKDYLSTRGFSFKYLDVSRDAKALQDMQRKTGQTGVPQLWINNVAVVGFDRQKIDRLLQISKQGDHHENEP